jgi:hypothetical protein
MIAKLRSPLARNLCAYAVLIFAPLLLLNHYLREQVLRPSENPLADTLQIKSQHYKEHADDFDLLLLGDSRTYISLQPHRIDAALGTRTANLATWGHYFATQYGQLLDIVDSIPPDTTVLWSIGHRNFQPLGEALWTEVYPPAQKVAFDPSDRWWLDKYPITSAHAPTLLNWGYPWHAIKQNLLRYGPLGETIEYAKGLRFTYKRRKNNPLAAFTLFDKPRSPSPEATVKQSAVPSSNPPASEPLRFTVESALATLPDGQLSPDDIASAQLLYAGGRATSLLVQTKQGSYYRTELDPDFFREEQRKLAEEILQRKKEITDTPPFVPAPPLWKNFVAILNLFQEHNIAIIVNEVEEAPYIYEAWGGKEQLRKFMREVVQPHVESHGIPYLRADFDQLTDADYFDFAHLNARGIEKYTPMLTDLLRPHLNPQAP